MNKQSAPYLEQQLPKPSRFSFEFVFTSVASICSIAGLIAAPYITPVPNNQVTIFSIALGIIVVCLFAYILVVDSKKLHRYAQAVIHTHYVNHLIRDALKEAPNTDLRVISEKILTSIAGCFSIITGKQCRACLIELNPKNGILSLVARDDISAISSKHKNSGIIHKLEENTDFDNLWHAKNGCTRYFLANNIIREWKRHRYKNSSFQVVGEPDTFPLGFYDVVYNWNLPYKSVLILPVRYISTFEPPDLPIQADPSHWNYWGFLCIDANSTGCFDNRFAPELGGTFADALYTLFSQSDMILDFITSPK